MLTPPHHARTWAFALTSLLIGCLIQSSRGDDPPAQPLKQAAKDLMPEIKPIPPVGIPDDPPPHEGAMIDIPLIIEPPDIIVVELLETLPGRPISGERLVRHDGSISLGFYGDVHVRGLTLRQAKAKIALHLRQFLNDDVLGLKTIRIEVDRPKPLTKPGTRVPVEKVPQEDAQPDANMDKGPVDVPRVKPEQQLPAPPATASRHRPTRTARRPTRHRSTPPNAVRSVRLGQARQNEAVPPPAERNQPDQPDFESLEYEYIEPADSHRVFVDVAVHNSKAYFVQGDVGSPGRLPFTGRDTTLDALNYAGGLIATAEPTDIHLYRPARGDKPAKDYLIDFVAILQGDARANLQIFPDDRLVVGRNGVVKKTIEIDRAMAPYSSVLNSLLSYGFTTRTIGFAAGDTNGTSQAVRDEVVRKWVDILFHLPGGKADGLDPAKLFEALPMKVEPKPDDKAPAGPK